MGGGPLGEMTLDHVDPDEYDIMSNKFIFLSTDDLEHNRSGTEEK